MQSVWKLPMFLLVLFLSSCGVGEKGDKKPKSTMAPSDAPTAGRAGIEGFQRGLHDQDEDSIPIKPGGNNANIPLGGNLSKDDVVFTDPDDPNAEIPNLDDLLQDAAKNKGPWNASDSVAIRESKTSGKPLLIWFTDSGMGKIDKPITQELFNRGDFEKWAQENVVRLRVDQSVQAASMESNQAKRVYVRNLKERYKVMGYPTLLVISPSGEVTGRYSGFVTGKSEFKFGQIKQATSLAATNYQKWKTDLLKKGYREWSDGKGRSVVARLAGYRAGEVVLIEPDGTRAKTNEKRLSDDDREWIRKEKEKRGIQ
jgi:thioredoxin-related protein